MASAVITRNTTPAVMTVALLAAPSAAAATGADDVLRLSKHASVSTQGEGGPNMPMLANGMPLRQLAMEASDDDMDAEDGKIVPDYGMTRGRVRTKGGGPRDF